MGRRKSNKTNDSARELIPWKQCSNCHVFIHMQDVNVHERICFKNQSSAKKVPPTHGYIKSGALYAKVEILDQQKKAKITYPHNLKQIVLMNPSTMEIFNYTRGGYVIFQTDCNEEVFRSWPSSAVAPSSILLPKESSSCFATDCLVKVHSYQGYAKLADLAMELSIAPVEWKTFMTSTEFSSFLLSKYSHCFVRAGMHLTICYLGVHCKLKITSIIGSKCDNSVEALTESCANLCIKDDSQSVSAIDSSLNTSSSDSKYFSFTEESESQRMCSTPLSLRQNTTYFHTPVKIEQLFEGKENEKSSHNYFVIELCTFIKIPKQQADVYSDKVVYFNQIGGLDKQLKTLENLLKPFILSRPSLKTVFPVPSGIVLTGASGTGKSLVVRAISNEVCVPVIIANGKEFNRNSTSSFSIFNRKFQEAAAKSPCILVLEDIHGLFEEEGKQRKQHYATENLGRLIDDLPKSREKQVIVIAVTNRPNTLDSSLTRPRRLETEILFGIPSPEERKNILLKIAARKQCFITEENLKIVADKAHGYTGADLEMVYHKAHLNAELRSHRNKDSNIRIELEDLMMSLECCKSSSMREFTLEVPKVYWHDIGGMHEVKEELVDMIDLPLRNPKAFLASGLTPVRGVLLFGPPGCSKTMIAKALATESKLNFIAIKGPELLNQWVGESEKAVAQLFKKARDSSPCVIFLDEVDSIASRRNGGSGGSNVASRVLSQLLTEIDGIDLMKEVSLVAATNRPDFIDPALMRPGRFDRIIYVPLPDTDTRKEIFNIKLGKMPTAEDIDIDRLVALTDGYSGAEIIAVCEEAAKIVIREDRKSMESVVHMTNLTEALRLFPPRTSKEQIIFYENYQKEFRYH